MGPLLGLGILPALCWLAAGIGAWQVLTGMGAPPRRDGRLRWGALAGWLALTGVVALVLSRLVLDIYALWSWWSILASGQFQLPSMPGFPTTMLWAFAATMIGAVGSVAALLAATWFARQLDWPALEDATGWRLDGGRRPVLVIAASSWLAWPIALFGTMLVAIGTADPTITGMADAAGMMTLPTWRPLALLLVQLLAIALALWPAWRMAGVWVAHAEDRDTPWLAGRGGTRVLLTLGLAEFLALGFITLGSKLVEVLAATLVPRGAGLPGSPLLGWLLPASWGLANIAALAVVAWLVEERFPWRNVEELTGWSLSPLACVALALTFAALVLAPFQRLDALQFLAMAGHVERPPWLWQAVGVALLVGAVVWLMRYRPSGDES